MGPILRNSAVARVEIVSSSPSKQNTNQKARKYNRTFFSVTIFESCKLDFVQCGLEDR